jgi:hypothetical protein
VLVAKRIRLRGGAPPLMRTARLREAQRALACSGRRPCREVVAHQHLRDRKGEAPAADRDAALLVADDHHAAFRGIDEGFGVGARQAGREARRLRVQDGAAAADMRGGAARADGRPIAPNRPAVASRSPLPLCVRFAIDVFVHDLFL